MNLGSIEYLGITITEIAWAIFILAWAIGWALRGSPIPIFRTDRRRGEDFIEDVIIASFFLVIGSTISYFIITYIISQTL